MRSTCVRGEDSCKYVMIARRCCLYVSAVVSSDTIPKVRINELTMHDTQ